MSFRKILYTIFLSIVYFGLYHQSGIMEGDGMAALILNWVPLFIG